MAGARALTQIDVARGLAKAGAALGRRPLHIALAIDPGGAGDGDIAIVYVAFGLADLHVIPIPIPAQDEYAGIFIQLAIAGKAGIRPLAEVYAAGVEQAGLHGSIAAGNVGGGGGLGRWAGGGKGQGRLQGGIHFRHIGGIAGDAHIAADDIPVLAVGLGPIPTVFLAIDGKGRVPVQLAQAFIEGAGAGAEIHPLAGDLAIGDDPRGRRPFGRGGRCGGSGGGRRSAGIRGIAIVIGDVILGHISRIASVGHPGPAAFPAEYLELGVSGDHTQRSIGDPWTYP